MRVVIGVGGNLGDRWSTMDRALERLARLPGVRSLRQSRWFETEPIGPPQAMFLNGAVLLEMEDVSPTMLTVLVDRLLTIERDLGRIRTSERNGPRTIDLDILWSDAPPSTDPRAVVPHPRLADRAFALAPLVELVPEARDPQGISYAEHLSRLGTEGVHEIVREERKNHTP